MKLKICGFRASVINKYAVSRPRQKNHKFKKINFSYFYKLSAVLKGSGYFWGNFHLSLSDRIFEPDFDPVLDPVLI